jgi:2-methylisocitrate lyase-like PEP mutase family enzyme
MVPWLVGADAGDLERRAERVGARVDSDAVTILGEFAPVGVTGTLGDALTRLRAYRDAGVDRIMLQHLAHDDLDAIALLPRLAAAMAAA